MKRKSIMVLCFSLALLVPLGVNAKKPNPNDDDDDDYNVPPGQPFQALQAQIDALQTEIDYLKNHFNGVYQKIPLFLNAGESAQLPVPITYAPVRIEVSLRDEDGDFPLGAQSNIMLAVIYRNMDSSGDVRLSWLGTDNTGFTGANKSFDGGETIAVIYEDLGDGQSRRLAMLRAGIDETGTGQIYLEQSNDFAIEGRYLVNIWY